jgi:2-oxo-4-hydroxy-4-carboxy-5-ureidoimidazoline decarboxylase
LVTLDGLNTASAADFAAVLGEVFEHAPWVAEQAASARPFATVAALHDAMMAAVISAPDDRIVAFLRGHPELSGAAALAGTMASHSTAEQAGLGLDRPADDIAALNAAYTARFGIPFIVCVRRHTRASLLSAFRRRLDHDAASEQTAALQEIRLITRLRLAGLVTGPGMPIVNGSLTTHVLDTSIGRPAAGIAVELRERGETTLLAQGVTDAQGRTHQPLLDGAPLRIGRYELLFQIGAYFAGRLGDDPPFLDVIPVQFGISEPESHYHIPLLVSPGAYSTYRGS